MKLKVLLVLFVFAVPLVVSAKTRPVRVQPIVSPGSATATVSLEAQKVDRSTGRLPVVLSVELGYVPAADIRILVNQAEWRNLSTSAVRRDPGDVDVSGVVPEAPAARAEVLIGLSHTGDYAFEVRVPKADDPSSYASFLNVVSVKPVSDFYQVKIDPSGNSVKLRLFVDYFEYDAPPSVEAYFEVSHLERNLVLFQLVSLDVKAGVHLAVYEADMSRHEYDLLAAATGSHFGIPRTIVRSPGLPDAVGFIGYPTTNTDSR